MRQLNQDTINYHINEARIMLRMMEGNDLDAFPLSKPHTPVSRPQKERAFRFSLECIYSHLNRAWNNRSLPDYELDQQTDDEHAASRRFPRDLDNLTSPCVCRDTKKENTKSKRRKAKLKYCRTNKQMRSRR